MMPTVVTRAVVAIILVARSSNMIPTAHAEIRCATSSDFKENARHLRRSGRGRGRGMGGPLHTSSDEEEEEEESDEDENTIPLSLPIRSIEGTENPTAAGLEAELVRMVRGDAPNYPDGQGLPGDTSMYTEPNPRMISNIVASMPPDDEIEKSIASDAFWQWGQFIDHDIGLTEGVAEPHTIVNGDCDATGDNICEIPFRRALHHFNPPLPDDDGDGTPNIFAEDCTREQLNEITGFLDASQVYGYTDDRASFLREGSKGKMKMQGDYKLLPFAKDGGSSFANAGTGNLDTDEYLFIGGDPRVNEQVGLTAMHTLWVREHNRIAEILRDEYDDTTDETVYQMARKLVTAEINHITYTEFLPLMIGEYAPDPFDAEYDPNVNPGVAQEFATVAFRVGHSYLSEEFMVSNSFGPTGTIALMDAFFTPNEIVGFPGLIDGILIGQTTQAANKGDIFVVDAVRNNLFGSPSARIGLDLVSLNIQRSRDHGIHRYNDVRAGYNLQRKQTFADVSSDPRVVERLEMAYGGANNVDLCDAWVCGIAEDPDSGLLGGLFSTIIGDQFQRFMNGDSFFYTIDPDVSNSNLIRKIGIDVFDVTYSDIVNANTIGGAKRNAFVAPPRDGQM